MDSVGRSIRRSEEERKSWKEVLEVSGRLVVFQHGSTQT